MRSSRIGHYEITAKLGSGGMGEVFRATDTTLGREVALKMLPADMAADPERLERFRREARALAALDHPSIVTVFSVEESEDAHCLTMQHVEGEMLERLLPEGGLSLERFFDFALAFVDGLASAHERGIIHRDLKPANAIVTDDGRLKILDFAQTRERGVMGTRRVGVSSRALPGKEDRFQAARDVHAELGKCRGASSSVASRSSTPSAAVRGEEGFRIAVLAFKSHGADADLEALAEEHAAVRACLEAAIAKAPDDAGCLGVSVAKEALELNSHHPGVVSLQLLLQRLPEERISRRSRRRPEARHAELLCYPRGSRRSL